MKHAYSTLTSVLILCLSDEEIYSNIVPKKQKEPFPGEVWNQWRGKKRELSGKRDGTGGKEEKRKRQLAKCVDYLRSIKIRRQ